MPRFHLSIFTLLAILLLTPFAAAQSIPGPFAPMDDEYLFRDPNFILPDNIGVIPINGRTAVLIDRNGDGRLNQNDPTFPLDPVMPLPAAAQNAANYFLSPTRGFLLVRGLTTLGSCTTGLRIQIYSVPASGTALTLIHDACLRGGLNNGVGEWYDTGLCNRNLLSGQCESPPGADLGTTSARLFAALTTDNNIPRYVWFDLNNNTTPDATDGQAVTTFSGPSNGMGQLTIALAGNFAFVQSDIHNGTSDFSVIDVCPSSPTFGQSVLGPAPGYDDVPTFLTAAVTQVSAGDVTIGTFNNGSPFGSGVVRPDCPSTPPPPLTGACCVSGVCTPGLTSAACTAMSGTWSLGLGCSPNPCPQPAPLLSVTMSGPATAVRGTPITYTLTYRNMGGAPATNVTVHNVIPAGTTFISASNSGMFSFGEVVWSVGSLPAMSAAHSVTVTVRAPCGGTSVSNSDYFITGDALPLSFGTPAVVTSLTAPPTGPVTVTVGSVPSRQPPLQGGDFVTHTITLTNTIAQSRENLNISLVRPGRSSVWEQVLDQGGGIVTIQNNGSGLLWNGNLAASATVTIIATTRLNACLDQFDTQTQLNDGQTIRLTDACFNTLGMAPSSAPFNVLKPLTASLAVSNLTPGQVGPSAAGGVFGTGTRYQAIRDGAMLEFEVTLTNQLSTTIPDAAFTIALPAAISLPAAPFLPPVPSGATYDAGTRTISYLGPIAPGASLTIRFAGTTSAAGECSIGLTGFAGFGATCRNTRAELRLLVVPPLPTQPYVVGAYSFRGLFIFTPGVDAALRDLLCLTGEIYAGIGRSPTGQLVVVGLPNFLFNPETLDLRFFDQALAAAGLNLPDDAAIDPIDGTLILTNVGSGAAASRIVRLDPVTSTVTTIIEEPAFGGARSVVVDPDGSIVFLTGSMGMRRIVDARTGPFPLPPGSSVAIPLPTPDYTDVPMGTPFSPAAPQKLVRTPTGDYSVISTSPFRSGNTYTAPNALIDVQRTTGAATVINRAITASAYNLNTGLPLPLPPALGALAFAESTDAFARSADRFFTLPTGTQNTNLTIINTTTTPNTIVSDFIHAPFAAYDAEVVMGGTPPPCPADFNHDTFVNSQDFFDFITAFFALNPIADFNHDTFINSQDFFDFVAAFFAGC